MTKAITQRSLFDGRVQPIAAKKMFDSMRNVLAKQAAAMFKCNSCWHTFDVPLNLPLECTISKHCPKCGSNSFSIQHP